MNINLFCICLHDIVKFFEFVNTNLALVWLDVCLHDIVNIFKFVNINLPHACLHDIVNISYQEVGEICYTY